MARKPKDVTVLHGHRVVTGPELRATFVEPEEALENPVRTRGRIIHGVVLVLLIALISAAVVVALAIIDGRIKLPTAAAGPAEIVSLCPSDTYEYAPTGSVVNVYNSTATGGLARTAADELQARGFVPGAVANKETSYSGVAAVISGADGRQGAFSVQRNIPGTDYFQDSREDASVDVVLSTGYQQMVAGDLVNKEPGLLTCPRENKRIADKEVSPVPGAK